MILAPAFNYHKEYNEDKLRSIGILNDVDRECILDDIINAELKLEEDFLSIAQHLLYPSTAKFGDEINSSEESEFYSNLWLIGDKLAFNLNNFIPRVRQAFTLDASKTQDILEEVYTFLEVFEHSSYAVGHVFKLSPYYPMIAQWKTEIQQNFPHEKFIARAGALQTQPRQEIIKNENSVQSFHQIEWLGTQKDLGELFVELKRKGWIKCEAVSDITETVKRCFTKSTTIETYFKLPNAKNPHPDIYTKRRPMRFDEIKPNVIKPPITKNKIVTPK